MAGFIENEIGNNQEKEFQRTEVLIIGGSFAGLAAALALGRSRRKTLIVDSGTPANRFTPHAHNLLTHDGKSPSEIRGLAIKDVDSYPTVTMIRDSILDIRKVNEEFIAISAAGKRIISKRILFANGLSDNLPSIEGFAECWGKSLIHCPYCHGYEYSDKSTAIIADGETAMELASLINHWTKNLTILTNGGNELTQEQEQSLLKRNLQLIKTPISSLSNVDGYLKAINFTNGNSINIEAAYIRPAMQQQTDLPSKLGVEFNQHLIKVDMLQQTSVPGIYAAGDNSSMMRSLSTAIATGTMAGAAMNRELILAGV